MTAGSELFSNEPKENMSSSGFLFGVFAKYWQPGAVKTRLAATVGPEAAASLHRAFLATVLQRFRSLAATRILCFAPADRTEEFARLAGADWQLQPQSAGDLGERMASFFRTSFERGCERVVLIGSDSPTLPVACVRQAYELLATHRVVLGPSDDGGYYLIGTSENVPLIFQNIPWSGPLVLAETLRRLEFARIPVAQLPPWYDVDDFEDLRRLAVELRAPSHEPLWDLSDAVNSALGLGY